MNQTHIRLLFDPKPQEPTVVVGLPGIGNIGSMVAQLLVESLHAKIFAEMYSPVFPDYVVIDKKGVCRPPRYEFYSSTGNRDLIVLTGDAQLSLENLTAHYKICGEVLDFLEDIKCDQIVVVDGIPSSQSAKDIFVAATSRTLVAEYSGKQATTFKAGRIIGPSGLLLGLAKMRKLEGVCILGQTTGLTVNQETVLNVYKFLRQVLGSKTKKRK